MTSPAWLVVTMPMQLSEVMGEARSTGGTRLAHCTVTFIGHVIVGGVLSSTVNVCVQVAELPQSSVTVCVLVIVPPHPPPTSGPVLQAYVKIGSQLSVPDAPTSASNSAKLRGHAGTSASHDTVAFAGQVITGGVLSSTVIVWLHVAELPQSSVTVCVRVMVPPHAPPTSGPVLQAYVRVASQRSEADAPGNASNAAKLIGHAGTSASHDTVIFVGHVITGGVLSSTIIVWLHVAELPQSSVTVCVRVIVPPHPPPTSGPVLQAYVRVGSQRSVAPAPGNASNAAKLTGHAGTSATHETVTFVGHVMTGGVLSSTVIVWLHVAELPQSSVTVCVRVIVPPHAPPTSGPVLQAYVRVGSQRSEADAPGNASNAAKLTGHAGTSASHDTVIFVGHVITGGVLSSTVKV